MAHPGFAIEQYVYHFLNQWCVGLQPSLRLDAKANGEIAVSLNLTLPSTLNEQQRSSPLSRNSGRGSRQRRRVRRAAAGPPRETNEARNSSNVESEENQCSTIESLPVDLPALPEAPTSVESYVSLPLASDLSQDIQEVNDEEPTSMLPHHSVAEPAVQCTLCQNQVMSFSRRTEFLQHICVDHFGEEQLVDFPEFLPNDIYQQAMKLSS